jgi:hypothetical protein
MSSSEGEKIKVSDFQNGKALSHPQTSIFFDKNCRNDLELDKL